jgi:hypothetical protein
VDGAADTPHPQPEHRCSGRMLETRLASSRGNQHDDCVSSRKSLSNAGCLWVSLALVLAIGLFATPAMSLPDGRAYELVSPTQENGGIGGVFPLGSLSLSQEQFGRPLQSTADGQAVTYLGEDFYQPRLGSLNQYLSLRDPDGWFTQNLTLGVSSTNDLAIEANPTLGFSADLVSNVVGTRASTNSSADVLTTDAPLGYPDLYLKQGESIQSLLKNAPPHRTVNTFGYVFELSRIRHELLYAGGNAGTSSVTSLSHILFEANDSLTLLPLTKENSEDENSLYESVNGQLRMVNVLPNGKGDPNASFGSNYGDIYNNKPLPNLNHVISDDGTRIFWTDENNHNLYIRENGNSTKPIGNEAQFQTASDDGSKAIFTENGRLKEYQTESGTVRELSNGSGVLGVLGASADGTYVYFVSTTALSQSATEGQPNLYLSHSGTVTFIATLASADDRTPALENFYGAGSNPAGDWYRTFAGRTAEVSPDGRFVSFMSVNELTGYNNVRLGGGSPDSEVFLYDAGTARLVCVSCRTDGGKPTASTSLPAPVDGIYQQRYLDDRGRLFFSTAEAVLPEDIDGGMDTYEYEDGHVYLISPGDIDGEAVFADASASGDDVFFTTRQPLVLSDKNQIDDLYDARVGGRVEGSPPIACAEEDCHETVTEPPSFGAATSSIFVGPGNIAPQSSQQSGPGPKKLTRAQKLAKALKTCRAKLKRHRRTSCEAQARKRYR